MKDSQGNSVFAGSLETWVVKDQKSSEKTFEKIWSRPFKSPAQSLSWNADLNYLIIGCEDGLVVPIEIDIKQPMQYTELREYKIHKGKVTGSFIDAQKNLMYTIGEDKYLRVFDFKTKEIINNNQISKSKLNKMIVHTKSKTMFIATKGGEIAIVDYAIVSELKHK